MLSTADATGECHPIEVDVNNGFTHVSPTPSKDDTIVRENTEIIKSANDKRLYRLITLPNKLRVLLISDAQTDKAAACLAVAVGSFSDPAEIPGLAHFCEHMILLGSRKYPEEDGYSKFVASHSGFVNAFTTPTETCYVLDIAPEYLYEALERFSDLFISPLFTESATEREVNAVDSEHEKNYSIDNRRILQVDKLLSSQDHDYSKFSTGNKATLFDNLKEKNISVRDELIKFHAKFYSSNIMALTVISKESLDEMEAKYAPLFQDIPNLNIKSKTWSTSPWTTDYLKKQISVVPVRDTHDVRLIWPIRDYTEFYKASPTSYITHLLGHESSGSLLSELKRRKLATALMTENFCPGSGFACIICYIELTDQGLEKIDEIITLVFQYINMLKKEGCQEWIVVEDQEQRATTFRFKCKEEPFQYALRLAPRIFKYAPQDILIANHLTDEYRPELIEEIFDYLTPENFRYFVVSKKVADSCDRVEQYYKTRYGYESIPLEKIEAWKNCGLLEALHLPPKNLYVASDFSLKCESNPDTKDLASGPRVIQETAGTLLWFKQDSTFKLPKSFVYFNLLSPIISQDPTHEMLVELFGNLFLDHVNEDAYLYSLAGLSFDIPHSGPSLRLTFCGYSHKMPLLVENMVNRLLQFTEPRRELFEVHLRKMELKVKNFTTYSALDQADRYAASTVYDRAHQHEERVAAVEQITYEDLVQFIPSFFNRIFVEAFVYGNEDEENALQYNEFMIRALKKYANWRPPISCPFVHLREVAIPTGPGHVLKKVNTSNEISAIRVYYQTQPINAESCAMHQLFEQLIHQPAFSKLRTEKQLGYIVSTGWHLSNSFQGICVVIQSKYHPRDLDEYIEEFMDSVEKMIEDMSDKEFEEQKESVIADLLLKPKTMGNQGSKYWGKIIRQRYDFDRYLHEVEVVKRTTKDNVLDFYRTYMKPTSEDRRKFVVYVTSHLAPVNSKEDAGVIIEDPTEFKRSLPLCPSFAPRRLRNQSALNGTE